MSSVTKGAEEGPDLVHEQLRCLESGEVSAPLGDGPSVDIADLLGPGPRGSPDPGDVQEGSRLACPPRCLQQEAAWDLDPLP